MIRVSISDSTPIRVTVTEEMVIRVTAFDYPPEIDTLNGRVDAVETSITGITQLVQEATMAATEAAESAEEASTAATEAIAVANSATETATNANQAIIQHTDSTTNPHDITTSQEFAEVIVTGLKSSSNGGDVPDDDYNWFKSLYASLVDGSVKSWIMGLVNQLKSLASRVLNLEYVQTVIYTVPGDCTSVTITQFPDGRPLNIQDGEKVEIIIRIPYVGSSSGGRLAIQLNGISSNIYRWGGAGLLAGVPLAGINLLNALYQPNFTLIKGEVLGMTNAYQQTTSGTWSAAPQLYSFTTEGLNATQITSIRIYGYSGTVIIPAGEKIIIKIYRQ